ncbi:pickpocket protein 28-like isoform X2 [Tenebrio molitor]|uniref:pickpocket protein 28-like isoform X2 n=1 Tax=Tenebrio molitor TaxID=7067 RepID=UPI003624A3BD
MVVYCFLIVTFATKETPLYKIPFPAITICPEVKSVKRLLNFKDLILKQNELNLTDAESKNLQYMTQLCENPIGPLQVRNTILNDTFTNEFFETLDEVKVEPGFFKCSFLGQNIKNCEDAFTPVFTDEGICYSFNILDRGHIFNELVYHYENYHKVDKDTMSWNMERGYLDNSNIMTYPWRALLSGASNGFTVYLLVVVDNENIDFMCKQIQGYKVVLHSPVRMPRLNQEYFRIPLDHAVVASVQPVVITTSQEVKTFDVAKRNCYFPSERKLKYFRTYSQQNCQFECLTNITLDSCGCVSFFMPRENSTKICGLGKYKCIKEAERALMLEELNKFRDSVKVEFVCLPLCTDLSYNIETSHTKWDWKKLVGLMVKSENLDDYETHASSLTVYFRVNHFISSERHELYGLSDFMANFGGLLGLFTGFSILSLMEVIYFLTVRICCNVRLYGRWRGVDN